MKDRTVEQIEHWTVISLYPFLEFLVLFPAENRALREWDVTATVGRGNLDRFLGSQVSAAAGGEGGSVEFTGCQQGPRWQSRGNDRRENRRERYTQRKDTMFLYLNKCLHRSSDSFVLAKFTQNRWTIQGVQIWVMLAMMGNNTRVPTPFYPLVLLFAKDWMYIIQVGRIIRICKIQFLERRIWHPPQAYPPVSCCNLLPFCPHPKCLTCSTFSFFSHTSHLLIHHINYLSIIFIVYCLHLLAAA